MNTAFNLANSTGTAMVGLVLGQLPLVMCFALAAAPAVSAAVLAAVLAALSRERPGSGRRRGTDQLVR